MSVAIAVHSQAAQDRIATLALSLFAIHGYPAPGSNRLGNIVHAAMASIGAEELRRPESISTASLGQLDGLVRGSVEDGRPRNDYGPDAARDQQARGGAHHGWHGDGVGHGRYGALQISRAKRDHASDSDDSGASGSGATGRGSSGYVMGGTGSEPAGAPFWGSAKGMMLTRGYANDNGMNWAPPDLMKMGRPALQVLKDSGLKGDGYQALHKPSGLHFDNPTIVNGAKYFKEHGGDYNGAAKDMDQVHRGLHGQNKEQFRGAIKEFVDPNDGLSVDEKRKKLGGQFNDLQQKEPDAKPGLDKLRQRFEIKQDAAPKAEAEAKQKGASADAKEKTAAAAAQQANSSAAGALAALKAAPKMGG